MEQKYFLKSFCLNLFCFLQTGVGKTLNVCIPVGTTGIVTHSVHDHAADLQDGHVGLLTLVSLPHYGAHSL